MYKYTPPEMSIKKYWLDNLGPFFEIEINGKWDRTLTIGKELDRAFDILSFLQHKNGVWENNPMKEMYYGMRDL